MEDQKERISASRLLEIGEEDSLIENIVDSASVDGVAEEAVDEIPLDLAAGRLGRESTDDRRSGAKIGVGILVEFRPTLSQADGVRVDKSMEKGGRVEGGRVDRQRSCINRN